MLLLPWQQSVVLWVSILEKGSPLIQSSISCGSHCGSTAVFFKFFSVNCSFCGAESVGCRKRSHMDKYDRWLGMGIRLVRSFVRGQNLTFLECHHWWLINDESFQRIIAFVLFYNICLWIFSNQNDGIRYNFKTTIGKCS